MMTLPVIAAALLGLIQVENFLTARERKALEKGGDAPDMGHGVLSWFIALGRIIRSRGKIPGELVQAAEHCLKELNDPEALRLMGIRLTSLLEEISLARQNIANSPLTPGEFSSLLVDARDELESFLQVLERLYTHREACSLECRQQIEGILAEIPHPLPIDREMDETDLYEQFEMDWDFVPTVGKEFQAARVQAVSTRKQGRRNWIALVYPRLLPGEALENLGKS